MIARTIEKNILKDFGKGKAIIVLGARQTGKTTLLKKIISKKGGVLELNGDEPDVAEIFRNANSGSLKRLIGNNKIVVVDEAQRIENIGLKLKLLTDNVKGISLFVTGSSSLEIASKINEPLTGRKYEYELFPLSFEEIVGASSLLTEKRILRHRLVYGSYPEIVTAGGDEERLLRLLTDSYLFKDILALAGVKKPDVLAKLLKAISYQVGSQVNYTELAETCGVDAKTVERYIDLLEKSYVIFRLPSFRRNLRNELKKSQKIYFYDNGVRNAIISRFTEVENREDIGALFENYIISERKKFLKNNSIFRNMYFWRMTSKQEIDLIEEDGDKLYAFEIKWNPKVKVRCPSKFIEAYESAEFSLINRDNYFEFLMK